MIEHLFGPNHHIEVVIIIIVLSFSLAIARHPPRTLSFRSNVFVFNQSGGNFSHFCFSSHKAVFITVAS